MSDSKYLDPRLQAREEMFQKLHLSTFETMGYARAIQTLVEQTGTDIESDNNEYQQLLRDYEVTKNLAQIENSPLKSLAQKTNIIIKQKKNANANCAQLCAAAISALNHWRILSEIPEDLRDKDEVTKALKDKFHQHHKTWEIITRDLLLDTRDFDS